MYKIWCDRRLIYFPPMIDGGCIVYNATLSMALNKVSTLTFTIPEEGVGYDLIQKLTSVITVYYGDVKVFHGRCMDITKDFRNQKKFHCEGALGFLNDSIVRPYSFSTDTPGNIFKYYIDQHNSRVNASKQLVVGDISTMQSTQLVRSSEEYPTTLAELQDKLIETNGGYVIERYMSDSVVLDYTTDSGGENGQVIQFGENLLNIEEFIDAANVATVIVPTGVDPNGEAPLTIKSVNNGLDYLENATGISLFGRIEKHVEWEDINVAANLKTAAQAKLATLFQEAVTLTISAVDLSMIDVDVDRLKLGEYNRVVSVPHGLDAFFQCSAMELNLNRPDQNKYTFGEPRRKLTDQMQRYRLK